ncbi:c-type cytochrome [Sphingobium phenoxybenzoativorans]|uniref:c-type cytochrome n=1 Tax=Sphingobium phenoxybenzoativorans TaxID=1592790 RepID=UPI0031BB8DFB
MTDWFLHFVMRSSVRTHALFEEIPQNSAASPGDEALVSAAGHYAQACAVCHGAPGVAPSPVMQAATPPAPDLARTAGEWNDRELFWIVRHGVKYTGMPAWPADRPDEVLAMVAFVRTLPTMSPGRYRALTGAVITHSNVQAGPANIRSALSGCIACHGSDGLGRGQGDIPILAGQSFAYLRRALLDFQGGNRPSAVMAVAVRTLSRADIDAFAAYFAALPGLRRAPSKTSGLLTHGDPERQLPACMSCHGVGKSGPLLAGQKPAYVATRLRQWRSDTATVDAYKSQATMAVIARRIPDEDIDQIAKSLVIDAAEAGPGGR